MSRIQARLEQPGQSLEGELGEIQGRHLQFASALDYVALCFHKPVLKTNAPLSRHMGKESATSKKMPEGKKRKTKSQPEVESEGSVTSVVEPDDLVYTFLEVASLQWTDS